MAIRFESVIVSLFRACAREAGYVDLLLDCDNWRPSAQFVGRIPQLNPAWVYCYQIAGLKNAIRPTNFVRRGLASSAIIACASEVVIASLCCVAICFSSLPIAQDVVCHAPHTIAD